MFTLQQLRERRAAAYARAQEFRDRYESGSPLTEEEQRQWKLALDDSDNLGRSIQSHPDYLNEHDAVGTIDLRAGRQDNAPEATAFRSWLRDGDERHLRAQGTTTGSAGGYMVPQGFRATVTETMKAFGGLRRLANVITTDNGANLPWPTNDDTSNVGVILSENTQAAEQDVTLGQKELGAYTYTSKLVRVSLQLIQDAGFAVDPWLARKLGQRIGRAQAAHWITGTGSSQPQGLLTAGTVGKTAASATAITYDELIDLITSVDVAYLDDATGVGWVMNQTTWGLVRKLKDSQNRPLVEPNLQTGRPTELLGYPVVIDNGMPNAATTTKPIAFGNFRAGYVIRDVNEVQVIRMVERYADYLQVGFLGYFRSDGLVQDPSAFKLLQMA